MSFINKILFIALFSCQMFQGVAQTILNPQFKGKESSSYREYVYAELVKHKDLISTLCERVTGSIQIILDKKGDIKSVFISGEMSDSLRQTLKEITFSSKGLWTPMEINGKKVDSYPIVLLMSLHLGEGCSSSREMTLKAIKSDFSKMLIGENSSDDSIIHGFVLPPLTFVWDYIPPDIGLEKK
jgi:hypothetical protein